MVGDVTVLVVVLRAWCIVRARVGWGVRSAMSRGGDGSGDACRGAACATPLVVGGRVGSLASGHGTVAVVGVSRKGKTTSLKRT
jgi:hypothetical protein